jgi:ferredoxin
MDLEESKNVASVQVDREICQSAAICLAYHIYELDDESKAVLLTKNGSNSDDPHNVLATAEGAVRVEDLLNPEEKLSKEEMQAMVLESAKLCPFNAIIVHDAEGKQIWPPL